MSLEALCCDGPGPHQRDALHGVVAEDVKWREVRHVDRTRTLAFGPQESYETKRASLYGVATYMFYTIYGMNPMTGDETDVECVVK